MAIEFNCSACGKLLRVPEGSGGKQAKCPHCTAVMKVPGDAGGGAGGGGAPSASDPPSSPWKEPPEPKPSKPESDFGLDAPDDPLGLGGVQQPAPQAPVKTPFDAMPQAAAQQSGYGAPNPGMGAAPGHGFQPASHAAPFTSPGALPHRGGMVLTFGILSLVSSSFGLLTCCCGCLGIFSIIGISLGIPAWLMGQNDLKQMASGQMDPMGQGQTKSGHITGMIGTILGGVTILLSIVLLLLQIFANVAIGPMQQGGGPGF